MKNLPYCLLIASILFSPAIAFAKSPPLNERLIGLSRIKLIKKFGEEHLRSYQSLGNQESITFLLPEEPNPVPVTFYLENDAVTRWQSNDREEMAKQYISEFASGNIIFTYPKVRTALLNALQKLPMDMYLEITDRRRPIIFIDYYTEGIAKFAGSMEFKMRETDPPTFQDGFYIIRLGDGLNHAENPESIEGIILHEIMHRVLEHLKNDTDHPCEIEREVNKKLKELGFEKEYVSASLEFGAKEQGDSPCHDILLELEKIKK